MIEIYSISIHCHFELFARIDAAIMSEKYNSVFTVDYDKFFFKHFFFVI